MCDRGTKGRFEAIANTKEIYPLESGYISLVLEVGLEPTKPKGRRFTVSRDCHYTIPAHMEPLYGFEP